MFYNNLEITYSLKYDISLLGIDSTETIDANITFTR